MINGLSTLASRPIRPSVYAETVRWRAHLIKLRLCCIESTKQFTPCERLDRQFCVFLGFSSRRNFY